MGDRKQIYEKMSDHLYWLGLLADKQFKYINLSYAVFRWGLLASLVAFIGVKTLPSLLTPPANNAAELRSLGINMFNGVFEPSAVQQLPDGKLLIAEDEPIMTSVSSALINRQVCGRRGIGYTRDYRFQTPSQRLGGFGT